MPSFTNGLNFRYLEIAKLIHYVNRKIKYVLNKVN